MSVICLLEPDRWHKDRPHEDSRKGSRRERTYFATYRPPEYPPCPRCRSAENVGIKDYRPKTITDVPDARFRHRIQTSVPRFHCHSCGKTKAWTYRIPGVVGNLTTELMTWIEEQCFRRSASAVARKAGIDKEKVAQIMARVAPARRAELEASIFAPRVLGMDEVYIKGQYRAVFVDIECKRVIGLLDTKRKGEINTWLSNLAGRYAVEVVTMDPTDEFRVSVRGCLGEGVKIVVDRWHMQRHANKAMDSARLAFLEGKRDKQRKQLRINHYLFTKPYNQLTDRQRLDLDGWLKNEPFLQAAYSTMRGFLSVYNLAKTPAQGRKRLAN